MQQTVPETPSPEVLTINKPDNLGRKLDMAGAAAGRNVDDRSPGKGRVCKAPRVAGAMGPPPPVHGGAANSAYLSVCAQAARLFAKIRAAVAGQAVPATLKSAFLEPVSSQLATELCVELLGRSGERGSIGVGPPFARPALSAPHFDMCGHQSQGLSS